MKSFFYLLLLFLVACTSNKSKEDKALLAKNEAIKDLKNGLFFYVIDNEVIVSVNNKQVYRSEDHVGKVDLNLVLDLDEYISSPTDRIKLELINKDCAGCESNWQILIYELIKDGEAHDYIHESRSSPDKFGKVWEIEYVWGDV